ncbi:lipase 1-like [Armigeres subalbatus]|uniref:lipase 1-like n=1 Tax=Armigeres subalbatus TaxID=124917 RepID=UPI002ED54270
MREFSFCFCLLILCISWAAVHTSNNSWFQIDDEDANLSMPDLISKYGYEVEIHTVTTRDGYGLTMFRILPQQPAPTAKYPVLLTHGLLGSSADFVIMGPNNSLAYLLADNGYDVWLANARGTRYSRSHRTLSVDSKEYWDFSWHEIGYYDLPVTIDYILKATSASKLHYIGFSQGTTIYFVLTTTRPEYNDKIALMIAFAPTAFVKQIRSPIGQLLITVMEGFKTFMASLNVYKLLPYTPIYNLLAKLICDQQSPSICPSIFAQIVGPHQAGYDRKLTTIYSGHTPAGASFNQIIHYGQIWHSGLFRQYDFGQEGNIRKYAAQEPPLYNLNLSTAPVALYYGLNDWLVHPRNVQYLAKVLPRVIAAKPVADKKFNHIDFLMGKKVRSQVYDEVISLMGMFN